MKAVRGKRLDHQSIEIVVDNALVAGAFAGINAGALAGQYAGLQAGQRASDNYYGNPAEEGA